MTDLASAGDLVSLANLTPASIAHIIDVARTIKRDSADYTDLLRGKRLSMVFEKESLRTRFTFDIGMQDLGGSAVFLDLSSAARMGTRESVRDMARNLERWTHGIVARTYRHRTVLELAGYKNCFAKQLGSSNPLNNARAVVKGLAEMRTYKQVAAERDMTVEELFAA